MKGGFLSKAIEREAAANPQDDVAPGQKLWDQKTIDTTVKVFRDILEENNAMGFGDLERRVRSGTGVREYRGRCAAQGKAPVATEDDDIAAQLIREHTRDSAFVEYINPIMEQANTLFGRVKARGIKDGLAMDSETEVKVLRDVIKECLIRHILKEINSDNSSVHAAGSFDAGLLATPQGYTGGDLNLISADTIRGLMEKGYGYQDDFLEGDDKDKVLKEIEFMDHDGKFVEVHQQKMTGYRTDRICWLSYDALDREKQTGLTTLMKKMISIPFELNKKCSLYLQACANFQVGAYASKGYYKKHIDGGYDDLNNGRKITAIYYPNNRWSDDGGELRVFKRRPNPYDVAKLKAQGVQDPEKVEDEEADRVEPRGGRLLLFRSRDVPHEVLASRRRRYAITLWLMGPPGPGDQPDDHYTPT